MTYSNETCMTKQFLMQMSESEKPIPRLRPPPNELIGYRL